MKKYLPLLASFALAAISVTVWVVPNRILMSFGRHTVDEIELAHRFASVAPWLALLLAGTGAAVTVALWRRQDGRLIRAASIVPLLVLVAVAWVARTSFAELMLFSPVEEARFVTAANAGFLEDEAMVLGVGVDGQSKAYPIRMLAYHHIVNDRLADEPYVVTY